MSDEIEIKNIGLNLGEFLKNSLIDQYNKVKNNPNPKKIDIKFYLSCYCLFPIFESFKK